MDFASGSAVKNLSAMQKTQEIQVRSQGLRRSPGGENDNPLLRNEHAFTNPTALAERQAGSTWKHCTSVWMCVSGPVMSHSLQPHGLYSPPGFFVHGVL